MNSSLVFDIYIFVLAAFIGYMVISKVPSILHTPLMSATNAIHGIIIVGAIGLASTAQGWISLLISITAVFLGTVNVVGGFVVTDRILGMFRRETEAPSQQGTASLGNSILARLRRPVREAEPVGKGAGHD
jgi:NAD(P) transhydrogenase subunit alpha